MKKLLKNHTAQLVLALLLGGALGVLFYPSKQIEERVQLEERAETALKISKLESLHASELANLTIKYSSEMKSKTQKEEELNVKISSLKTEVRSLKQKTTETSYKLVKPDGTIVEKKFKESELEETSEVVTEVRQEFNRKVKTIEDRWKKVFTERIIKIKKTFDKSLEEQKELHKEEIKKLKSEKITTVNPKHFGAEVGVDTSKDLYIHGSYDVYGPFFMGGHVGFEGYKVPNSAGIGLGVKF